MRRKTTGNVVSTDGGVLNGVAGVGYLHDNNVVHGDLRPEHILLLRPIDQLGQYTTHDNSKPIGVFVTMAPRIVI